MKIKCKTCESIVAMGELKEKKFILHEKPKGTILKNKSNNPENWTAVCSKCQKTKKEKKDDKPQINSN